MSTRKPRGRPRKPVDAPLDPLDVAIARTVYLLAIRGFKQRGGILEEVAAAAKDEIERDARAAIHARGVEEIYERWREHHARTSWHVPSPGRYTRESLRSRRETGSLPQLARRTFEEELAIARGVKARDPLDWVEVSSRQPRMTTAEERKVLEVMIALGLTDRAVLEGFDSPKPRGRPRKIPK